MHAAKQRELNRGHLPADEVPALTVTSTAVVDAPTSPVSEGLDGSRALPVRRAHGLAALLVLAALGLAQAGLLSFLVVVYANVPTGYDVPYRLSLESPALFRALWPYPTLAWEPATFSRLAALTIVGAWAVYLLAWGVVGRACAPVRRRQMLLTVAAFAVIYHLALVVIMPPVLSTDIYHYVLFGRMVAFYGLNPYVTTGAAIPADPFFDYAGWQLVPSHYGPLWTLLSAGVAALGADNVLLTVLLFKAVAALFSLASCVLVVLLARRLTGGDGLGALLLYGWNPLILVETAGSGHNDVAMMTVALLGLLLVGRGRLLLGLVALILSVFMKYLSALLLLFVVVRLLANEPTWRRAAALVARAGAATGILALLFYAPFWAGPDGFDRLVTVGAPFKSLVRFLLRGWLTGLLGGGEAAQATAEALVIAGLHLAFGLLVLLLAWLVWSRRPGWAGVLAIWGVASLVYMNVVYGWNLPWLLVPTITTACVVVRLGWSLRVLAAAHALGLLLMLPYALLVRV